MQQETAVIDVPQNLSYVGIRKLLGPPLALFLLACVFDPADLLLGMKLYLFLLCWLISAALCVAKGVACRIDPRLVIYVLLFIFVPLLSITFYWMTNGSSPFEGFQLLKGYVLITLAALLYVNNINLMPLLAKVLTFLSVAIIATFIALSLHPELFAALYVFGQRTGIVLVDNRDYGSGFVLLQVYFVTSPMLAVSIAYYFHAFQKSVGPRKRTIYAAMMLVNVCGMLLAGTRNNIAVGVLLPVIMAFLYSRHKARSAVLGVAVLAILTILFWTQIVTMVSPQEFSNDIKLRLLLDYREIFSDPTNLLLGQGLGAYHFWSAKSSDFYISELTYLEVVRNFGIFGAAIILALLLYPLLYAFVMKPSYEDKHIVVGYGLYLLMCAVNPNLFSSMGILILSIVLANIFLDDRRSKRGELRGMA